MEGGIDELRSGLARKIGFREMRLKRLKVLWPIRLICKGWNARFSRDS
jgi:hypothetical protein